MTDTQTKPSDPADFLELIRQEAIRIKAMAPTETFEQEALKFLITVCRYHHQCSEDTNKIVKLLKAKVDSLESRVSEYL